MRKLIGFLGASLMVTTAFGYHYNSDDFTSVKVSYNTGGYYSVAQAEAAAADSLANLEAGVMPNSTMKIWGSAFCKDINSAHSHQAVSEYIQTRLARLGAGWTRDDVIVYSADFKSATMTNGQEVYYTTITALVPCVLKTASRLHR